MLDLALSFVLVVFLTKRKAETSKALKLMLDISSALELMLASIHLDAQNINIVDENIGGSTKREQTSKLYKTLCNVSPTLSSYSPAVKIKPKLCTFPKYFCAL